MAKQSKAVRQTMGCGYLPPGAATGVWQPPSGKRGYCGPALTVCAGYTANLPEVLEATLARAHWKVGAIVPACEGEMPSEALLNAILILDGGYSQLEGWLMTDASEGGGRQ